MSISKVGDFGCLKRVDLRLFFDGLGLKDLEPAY